MTRCRVYYRQDGKISVDHADQRPEKAPEGMTNDQWIDKQFLESGERKPDLHIDSDLANPLLPNEDVDDSSLPNGNDPTDKKDRDRWRGTKAAGIRIDNSIVLRKDLAAQLDAELAKPSPNAITAMRLQRRLDRGDHD